MRALSLVVLLTLAAPVFAGEKLSGRNVDVRTNLAFKVPDASVQKFVPEGWETTTIPGGPAKGANALLVLVDSFSQLNAEGKPAPSLRGGVLVLPVKKVGTSALTFMVAYGIVVGESAPGAYGVYSQGTAAIERKVAISADGKSSGVETWELQSADGGALSVQLEYGRGPTTRSTNLEAKVYSAARPEFFRIYRWEQVADVARSAALGIERVTKFSLKVSGAKLGALFDGTEQLLNVTSVPSYSRSVFLPD